MGVSKYNQDVIKYGDILNTPAGGGGLAASVQTSNYTITEDEDVGVDSTGGTFTVTLKASPSTGDVAVIRDVGQNCGTTNVAIARNGSTINGAATDENLDVDNGMYMFVYNGSTWKFTPFSGPGLNEAEVDARIVATAKDEVDSRTYVSVIADDSVLVISLGGDVFAGNFIVSDNQGTSHHGLFRFRAAASSALCSAMVASGITATTGVLSGTTGADATVTVSAHTNNNIYIENRLGGSATFCVTVNCLWP